MLNLSTAFILFFLAIIIVGSLRSLGSEKKDPSGRVLSINPKGTVVDQAVFHYDFFKNPGTNFSMDQIQTRDLIQLIRTAADDEDIPAVFIDFSSTNFAGPTTAINIAKELKDASRFWQKSYCLHRSSFYIILSNGFSSIGSMGAPCW